MVGSGFCEKTSRPRDLIEEIEGAIRVTVADRKDALTCGGLPFGLPA